MSETKKELTGYELSRDFFDFCFENTYKVNPNHIALYFFCIENWNRLGWKKQFGLPRQTAMDAISVKNYRTYSKAFEDLVEWGFIKVIQRSQNQYSANIIALVKNAKASTKALSKAIQWHDQKQSTGTASGTVCIDKPKTIEPKNLKPKNNISTEVDEEKENVFYKNFVSIWFEVYEKNFSMKPTFGATEGKKIKSVIGKLKKKSADSNYEWNPENSEKVFRHFLTIALADAWIRDNFQLQILDSKFDIIIQKGINGKSSSENSKGTGMAAYKDELIRGTPAATHS